ncbi:MAG: leucine-rich repeat domain-containing protein [Burkholderiaceae bacterium]|nr:leucine-rich repeat domain-containing protein [Burkholderiaceae bacterium]
MLFNKAITTLISYPARKFGTSYSIPESVASIDGYAFLSAAALTNITIPASVSSIGIGALSGMAALTSITVHADNANYRSTNGVLFNKASTTLIIYPARKIGTSYSIPASVTSIGGFAFLSAAALTSITIPASVANIGDYVFSGATALRSFYFLGNAPTVTVNSQFTAPGSGATAHVTSVATGFENNVLETWNGLSVEILGDGDYVCSTGFMKTTETTNLFKITASVASAHSSGPCSGSVVIPIDVTSIGDYAFVNATGLTSITIPASVTSIGTGAFRGATALTSITIPASVTSIGTSAFLDAIALSGVNFLGDEPATVGTSPFSNVAVGARAHIKATAKLCVCSRCACNNRNHQSLHDYRRRCRASQQRFLRRRRFDPSRCHKHFADGVHRRRIIN